MRNPSTRHATLAASITASLLLVGLPAGAQTVAMPASAYYDLGNLSPQTAQFINTALPTAQFLDEASRMALRKSHNRNLRQAAHTIAMRQTIAANSMTAFLNAGTPTAGLMTGRSVAAPQPANPLAPVGNMVMVPIDAAGNVVGNVLTGGALGAQPMARYPTAVALLPNQIEDLKRLAARRGTAFDRLYVATQLDAMAQLLTIYRDYEQNGDNDALRRVAQHEIPLLERDIGRLRRL